MASPSIHAATRAGALDTRAREALLNCKLCVRIVPQPPAVEGAGDACEASPPKRAGCRYRTGAELLRTLGIDAFACPSCPGRMRVLALVREKDEVRRFLQALGEATDPPERAPARGPPYWASRALRIRSGADTA